MVVDRHVIECEASSFVALDVLLSSFYTFNTDYPAELTPVYSFLERLYNIPGEAAKCKRINSTVHSLLSKLKIPSK